MSEKETSKIIKIITRNSDFSDRHVQILNNGDVENHIHFDLLVSNLTIGLEKCIRSNRDETGYKGSYELEVEGNLPNGYGQDKILNYISKL